MGVDCDLLTDKGRFPMDRLYVFDEVFDEGKEYSSEEGIETINQEIERLQYRLYWLSVAKYHIVESEKFLVQDKCHYDERERPTTTST